MNLIQDFASKLGKTKHRQLVFGQEGALVCQPIEYQDVLARGLISEKEDPSSITKNPIKFMKN